MQPPTLFRILVIDDNPAIHEDFRKILLTSQQRNLALDKVESVLFETPQPNLPSTSFELDSAFQGKEALDKVAAAVGEGRPYAMAFVDIRMPPGWDGVETISHLWKADRFLQTVICTAYSDYSWEAMSERLGVSDNCVLLKKPFDNIEVLQLAHTLTRKWYVTQQAHLQMETLEAMVQERTRALQEANRALQLSEQRFATAFRASPAPVLIQTVQDSRIVDVNEAFLKMTGFTRPELVGRPLHDLHLCIEYGHTSESISEQQSARDLSAQISTKSDGPKQALVSAEHINISGEPHILLLIQDISERLKLEEQLRHSQKMEAIGQLAAGVAHDFNNLLTIIQGHASLQLALSGLTPDMEASLRQIEQAAGRAADLTRQLLAFSRRQIMRPRIIELSEHLRQLTAMLRRLIGEQIELHCHLSDGLPPVCADATSVEQVVMNLLVNARDAMPRGGRVTVSTEAITLDSTHCSNNLESTPGKYICLSVADTGIGMDEATRQRIFEPFFTTKEMHKGTGLGLSTVYGIAKQHGGWVEVISAPECGSTFRVYFPVADGKAEKEESPEARREVSPRPHTVLVVEDDDAVRELVKEILVSDNFNVFEAEHADAALEVWARLQDEIEILLTDMVMPGSMNGLELSERLLADKPDLKVVYTSGYSTELFNSQIELQDGINYLPKPYPSAKLTAMLRKSLKPDAGC